MGVEGTIRAAQLNCIQVAKLFSFFVVVHLVVVLSQWFCWRKVTVNCEMFHTRLCGNVTS